ncbi:MAG: NADP-specific glutamate dehydrogenase [Bacteroidetes bacterium]|nr:MAG: NADP-specific glutamate dehydrogenase [Bacteroidota bacterium]
MITNRVEDIIPMVMAHNPDQPEFLQAVTEVVGSIQPFLRQNPSYLKANILDRITEPDRVISFRVSWFDDEGDIQVNRGYRVQFNNAIGPYKGGLRFHPSVNVSILKFLGFEQIFKNALTGLPMGGGKGGANFDPKGKSDNEIMRFCQAFMNGLANFIGADVDVPAGDIGVGSREIGYLYGQYKKIRGPFEGVLTGKPLIFGGSQIRAEATGYGLIYFVVEMLKVRDDSLAGKSIAISGSGNVAQYAAEKAIELGGKVLTLSDSSGTIYDPAGIDAEKLAWVMELKNERRGRIREYAEHFDVEYYEGARPWQIGRYDIALPCATQNELDGEDAEALVENGTFLVAEGANMPSTPEAIKVFHKKKILYGLGKAANAGGVAVSGLEMSQNSMRLSWSREEVDRRLKNIMVDIHNQCVEYGTQGNYINYVDGANIAGFIKVADAMIAQGAV